jgi:sigma-B regulation protein RsbU (phosphoserine phosphatase)
VKILLAEDDPIARRLLQSYLAEWGHDVTVAVDGTQGWELFERGQFSVVISDWMMPGLDGPELIRRIRAAERPGYAYLILLTSKSRREDLVQGMEAGADDFMAKPFDRDELRVRLRAGERIIQLERDLACHAEELRSLNDRLALANARMRRDLDAAARVQRALLPATPPDQEGVRFAWIYRPCDVLGGDILNCFRLGPRHVGLYILDVSGHGVASALLSVTISRFLSPVTGPSSLILRATEGADAEAIVPPAEVAQQLNRRFCLDPTTEQYFTLIYGVLDLERGEFGYVTAGHPGLVHLPHDGAPTVLPGSGLPIGVGEDDFEENRVALRPGDRLYLYSDGITEAIGDGDQLFGRSRLLQTLDIGRDVSLSDSLTALIGAVEAWIGGAPLADDVSALAVEVTRPD